MSMKKHRDRQYPQGKITEHDEGQVGLRIAADPRRQVVVIEFANPVKWLGLPREEALGLAALLTKHAQSLPDVPAVNSPPAEGTQ